MKNRQRNGKGTEYYTLWNSGEIKQTGIWENDKLIKGTVYDVILDNKNELYIIGNYLYSQLYDGLLTFHNMIDYVPEANIAKIKIDNGNIEIDKKSIIPLSTVAEEKGCYMDIN